MANLNELRDALRLQPATFLRDAMIAILDDVSALSARLMAHRDMLVEFPKRHSDQLAGLQRLVETLVNRGSEQAFEADDRWLSTKARLDAIDAWIRKRDFTHATDAARSAVPHVEGVAPRDMEGDRVKGQRKICGVSGDSVWLTIAPDPLDESRRPMLHVAAHSCHTEVAMLTLTGARRMHAALGALLKECDE